VQSKVKLKLKLKFNLPAGKGKRFGCYLSPRQQQRQLLSHGQRFSLWDLSCLARWSSRKYS